MEKPPEKNKTGLSRPVVDSLTNHASMPWRYFRRLGLVIILCLLIFVLLNYDYFSAQLRFFLHRPTQTNNQVVSSQNPTMQPNLLLIPSLGITAPVIYIDTATETEFQKALLGGVVHYPGTASPGQLGNVYVFGHSSDYIWSKGKYKSVFALLPKIKNGADITVSDNVGRAFTYKVFNQLVVAPNDLSVLDQGGYKRRFLTVQTSYPVGTALKRYIVQAELVTQ